MPSPSPLPARAPAPRAHLENLPLEFLEPLEPRLLLSALTLITHGYQPLSSSRPNWLDTMGAAVAAQAGPDTAVYALRIEMNASNVPFVQGIQQLAGISPTDPASDNAESVLLLDWADASGILFSYASTATIANLVAPYLLSPIPTLGITHPFAESPIHLVGHSRGASLVSELALDLAAQGVWVDHMTTLDPYPVSSDPAVKVWDNIWFADNDYQTDHIPGGSSLLGAHNINLTSLSPDIGHTQVHSYYHGSIDLAAATDGDGVSIADSWYATPSSGPRDQVGFAWSLIAAQARPADGLWPTATRQPTTLTATGSNVWDNIAFWNLWQDQSLIQGQALDANLAFEDQNLDATLSIGFDLDTNPYNGFYGSYSESLVNISTPQGDWSPTLDTSSLAPADYHVYARITNGVHTRYYYAPALLTITPSTPPTATLTYPTPNAAIPQATINTQTPYLDITFEDHNGQGLDASSITDAAPEFYLAGPAATGVTIAATPTLVPDTTATYRYTLTQPLGVGPVTIHFLPDAWSDQTGTPNLPATQTFTTTTPQLLPSDFNLDGQVNVQDINPFVQALTDFSAYQQQYPDAILPLVDPNADNLINVQDINAFVARLTGQPTPFAGGADLFDEAFYLQHNPDVVIDITNGLYATARDHFIAVGQFEGRQPNPFYDESFYLAQNPDVALAVADNIYASGFEHFARYGQTEARAFSHLFDERYYLATNPDVASAVTSNLYRSGFEQYLLQGRAESRPVIPLYDESTYLTANPDILPLIGPTALYPTGFDHFLALGQSESRRFSPYYYETAYLLNNPDILADIGPGKTYPTAFEHYLLLGQFQGLIAV